MSICIQNRGGTWELVAVSIIVVAVVINLARFGAPPHYRKSLGWEWAGWGWGQQPRDM